MRHRAAGATAQPFAAFVTSLLDVDSDPVSRPSRRFGRWHHDLPNRYLIYG